MLVSNKSVLVKISVTLPRRLSITNGNENGIYSKDKIDDTRQQRLCNVKKQEIDNQATGMSLTDINKKKINNLTIENANADNVINLPASCSETLHVNKPIKKIQTMHDNSGNCFKSSNLKTQRNYSDAVNLNNTINLNKQTLDTTSRTAESSDSVQNLELKSQDHVLVSHFNDAKRQLYNLSKQIFQSTNSCNSGSTTANNIVPDKKQKEVKVKKVKINSETHSIDTNMNSKVSKKGLSVNKNSTKNTVNYNQSEVNKTKNSSRLLANLIQNKNHSRSDSVLTKMKEVSECKPRLPICLSSCQQTSKDSKVKAEARNKYENTPSVLHSKNSITNFINRKYKLPSRSLYTGYNYSTSSVIVNDGINHITKSAESTNYLNDSHKTSSKNEESINESSVQKTNLSETKETSCSSSKAEESNFDASIRILQSSKPEILNEVCENHLNTNNLTSIDEGVDEKQKHKSILTMGDQRHYAHIPLETHSLLLDKILQESSNETDSITKTGEDSSSNKDSVNRNNSTKEINYAFDTLETTVDETWIETTQADATDKNLLSDTSCLELSVTHITNTQQLCKSNIELCTSQNKELNTDQNSKDTLEWDSTKQYTTDKELVFKLDYQPEQQTGNSPTGKEPSKPPTPNKEQEKKDKKHTIEWSCEKSYIPDESFYFTFKSDDILLDSQTKTNENARTQRAVPWVREQQYIPDKNLYFNSENNKNKVNIQQSQNPQVENSASTDTKNDLEVPNTTESIVKLYKTKYESNTGKLTDSLGIEGNESTQIKKEQNNPEIINMKFQGNHVDQSQITNENKSENERKSFAYKHDSTVPNKVNLNTKHYIVNSYDNDNKTISNVEIVDNLNDINKIKTDTMNQKKENYTIEGIKTKSATERTSADIEPVKCSSENKVQDEQLETFNESTAITKSDANYVSNKAKQTQNKNTIIEKEENYEEDVVKKNIKEICKSMLDAVEQRSESAEQLLNSKFVMTSAPKKHEINEDAINQDAIKSYYNKKSTQQKFPQDPTDNNSAFAITRKQEENFVKEQMTDIKDDDQTEDNLYQHTTINSEKEINEPFKSVLNDAKNNKFNTKSENEQKVKQELDQADALAEYENINRTNFEIKKLHLERMAELNEFEEKVLGLYPPEKTFFYKNVKTTEEESNNSRNQDDKYLINVSNEQERSYLEDDYTFFLNGENNNRPPKGTTKGTEEKNNLVKKENKTGESIDVLHKKNNIRETRQKNSEYVIYTSQKQPLSDSNKLLKEILSTENFDNINLSEKGNTPKQMNERNFNKGNQLAENQNVTTTSPLLVKTFLNKVTKIGKMKTNLAKLQCYQVPNDPSMDQKDTEADTERDSKKIAEKDLVADKDSLESVENSITTKAEIQKYMPNKISKFMLQSLFKTLFSEESERVNPPFINQQDSTSIQLKPVAEENTPIIKRAAMIIDDVYPMLNPTKCKYEYPVGENLLVTFDNRRYKHIPSVSKILNETLSDKTRGDLIKWNKSLVCSENTKSEQFHKEHITNYQEFHDCVRRYILGTPINLLIENVSNETRGSLISLLTVLPKLKNISILDSVTVHSQLPYHGIVDCVAKYKREPYLIEWKQASSPENIKDMSCDAAIQVAAYIGALNFDTKYTFPVKSGMIVVGYTDGSPADIIPLSTDDCRHYWKLWLNRLQKYINIRSSNEY